MTRRIALLVACVVVLLGACSWDTPAPVQAPASARLSPAELLGVPTAQQVVNALPREGLSVVNPVDGTAAECSTNGCDQEIITDRFRILSFSNTAAAEKYAAAHEARQVETLAVSFSPNVPPAEQDSYWKAIVKLAR